MEEALLQPEPSSITKIIQIYQAIKEVHGVLLIGSTGVGKSTLIDVTIYQLI